MANKTKNELLQEIQDLQKELMNKEQELIKYEQISACLNMGEEYKLIYDNFINAGFTEEQAYGLLQITMDRTVNEFMRDIRNSHRYNPSYRNYRY